MAKTRRKKINKSPGKPYRNAKAYIAVTGERVAVKGVRGRTGVRRVVSGARLHRIRETGAALQVPHTPVGDRKARPVFLGRQYTGVARSKVYPTHGKKRGGVAPLAPVGLMARAAKAVKRVIVKDPSAMKAVQ